MADAPKIDPKDAKIAELEAKLVAAAQPQEVKIAALLAERAALKPEHMGEKTYVVGPTKHYRNGRTYAAGELVTVVNERPAKDWKLVGAAAVEKAIAAKSEPKPVAPSTGRASDKNVGG